MQPENAYQKQNLSAARSRVETLLWMYDRAIVSLEACDNTRDKPFSFAEHLLRAEKAILAIHAGLEPDKHEVAFNIARLLHFVSTCIEKQDFQAGIRILSNLREGFAAVAEEVNELERTGKIPPMPQTAEFFSLA